ncbi:MAG: hypothetical protein M1813_007034 [Trichoglossum hirsutum]|nr:MAG: hypothetical protein M1813_007034 [Trichoglossum hirsutum]
MSSSFPFLSLPAETRNKIYRCLLTCSGTISSPRRPAQHAIRNGLQPAILATSRQIHNEALRILYQENRVEVYVSDAAYMPSCNPRNVDLIESFNVLVEVSPVVGMATREQVEVVVDRLAKSPLVRSLRVEIPWKATPARMHMIKVRRLLEPFKRLRNVGNVEFVECMKPESAAVFKKIMESKGTENQHL